MSLSQDQQRSKHIVLVAEDEPSVLQNAFDIVEDAGFTALGAPNGDHALRILESRDDVCIVFTDVNMPGTLDGVRLADMIHVRWPNIRLIITSGRVDVKSLGTPKGARVVQKPYRFTEIATHLEQLAGGC